MCGFSGTDIKVRRRIVSSLSLLLILASCRRPLPLVETIEEEGGEFSSTINAADAATAVQLLKGFHEVEGGAWRWTKAQFTVVLNTPQNAPKNGGALTLRYSLPDAVLSRTGPIRLSVNVNGVPVRTDLLTKSGDQVYTADVPANALSVPTSNIEFALDKFLAAGTVEIRELGLIFFSATLSAK